MKRLLILGAGGHGKVIAELAEACGKWESIAFLDDRHAELNGSLRWPVIGGVRRANRFRDDYSHAFVAVGNSDRRLAWLNMLETNGFSVPTLIHPTAWVSPSAKIGNGGVVMANVTLQADVIIGDGSIINTGASVDHDCRIEYGVHICPGVSLGGDVKVGKYSWIGIGASVIQGINIGERVTVGAGAAVVKDLVDGITAVGVPARGISGGLE